MIDKNGTIKFEIPVYSQISKKNRIPIYEDTPIELQLQKDVFIKNKHIIDCKYKEDIYLKGTFLYLLYPMDNNYSHFTIKSIQNFLLAQRENILSNNIKIIISNNLRFQKELIEIFNINNYEVVHIQDNLTYRLEKCFYSSNYNAPLFDRNLLSLFSYKFKPVKKDINIYISRINAPLRKALNENRVIEFLKKLDRKLKIIDFAKISVLEQIQLIKRAKYIYAPHGASGANFIYLSDGLFNLVEIFSSNRFDFHHVNLISNKNCNYSGVVNAVFPKNNRNQNAPYIIDLSLLEKAIFEPNYSFRS